MKKYFSDVREMADKMEKQAIKRYNRNFGEI